jgi:hypothetical protein
MEQVDTDINPTNNSQMTIHDSSKLTKLTIPIISNTLRGISVMKANSHVKFTNILDRIQLYFDSLARSLSIGRIYLSKIGIHRNIFTHTSHLPVVAELKPDAETVTPSDSVKPTLRDRGNTGNRQLQKPQFDRVADEIALREPQRAFHQAAFALRNRRHHSLNWRWQSRLMNWA